MYKVSSRRAILYGSILVLLSWPRASAETVCSSADVRIPLHVPPEIGAVRISDLGLAAWNGLSASFLLENRGSKEISSLTVVLEYETKKGDYSQAVVYQAATDTKRPRDNLIRAESVEPLPHPILPGTKEWISGNSPYTPPECPVSARLIMLDIHFGDDSDLRWESADWWTEPLLADYPTRLSIPDSSNWTSDEYLFIGRVNGEGKLDLVEPLENVVPLPGASEVPSGTVAEALKKLTFSPGLDRGKPSVANLIFVVKFIRPGAVKTVHKRPEHESIRSKPTVFISLYPRDSSEKDWGLEFGNGFGQTRTVIHR
jgi:hypothetical protein